MQLNFILCALHPLMLDTSVLRSMQPLTSTTHSPYATSVPRSTTHIYTLDASCAVPILETCTSIAPALGVHIHPCTYTYSLSTQKMFYSYTRRGHPKIFISLVSFSLVILVDTPYYY